MPKKVEIFNTETGEKLIRNAIDAAEIVETNGGLYSYKKGKARAAAEDEPAQAEDPKPKRGKKSAE